MHIDHRRRPFMHSYWMDAWMDACVLTMYSSKAGVCTRSLYTLS